MLLEIVPVHIDRKRVELTTQIVEQVASRLLIQWLRTVLDRAADADEATGGNPSWAYSMISLVSTPRERVSRAVMVADHGRKDESMMCSPQ